MARTDSYRQQHQDIMKLAASISAKLTPAVVTSDSQGIRALMSQLAGKLGVHLAMEDNSLYPNMLGAKDANLSALAKKYMAEMGGIAAVVKKYTETYPTPQSIAAKPQDFIRETQALIAALSARVKKEESELYPAADKM